MKMLLLPAVALLAATAPANASLVVTRTSNVAAGMAAFGSVVSLLDWRNVFSGPGSWTTGSFGGSAVGGTSATDSISGSIVGSGSGGLYITNWIDGPGFSVGGDAAPELAISGPENFTLTFTHAVHRIGFAVSTGTGLLLSEVRNTGTDFDITANTTASGDLTLLDPGTGATYWVTVSSLDAFSSLTFTESPVFGDGIWDQYFGNFVAGGIPEPASWALMIAGFGMVGSALRRQRTAQPSRAK